MSAGDMLWKVGGNMPKAFYRTNMEGRHKQGRARNRWTDVMEMGLLEWE